MEKIGEGMVSEAFLENGRVFLVGQRPDTPKIYRELKSNLDFFECKIRSLKIPGKAEIIEPNEEYQFGAITFDYVPGIPLSKRIDTCTDSQKFAIGKKLAEFITEVTTLAPRNGDSKEKEITVNCTKFENAVKLIAPYLTDAENLKLNSIAANYRTFLKRSNFCMTHSDLHFENLIVDDNNILVGIIDFGNVEYYVAETEFMWLQGFGGGRYRSDPLIFDAMIKNYLPKLNVNDIKLVRLVGAIRFFKHVVHIYPNLLEESITNLREMLAKYNTRHIDLHMHTDCSDGEFSVRELLQMAQGKNLDIISITDHNNVNAYKQLRNVDVADIFSGSIIPGIEIGCKFDGYDIEILGYGIDIDKIAASQNIMDNANRKKQSEFLEHFKVVGRKLGLVFDETIKITDTEIFAGGVFGNEICAHAENEPLLRKLDIVKPDGNVGNFYRNGEINPKSPFYIDRKMPSAEVIIDEIHAAGGLAFLAHPLLYEFEDKQESIEKLVKTGGIDGLECYHSDFDWQQTEILISICNKYKKFSSGGSDFHGRLVPNRLLGQTTNGEQIGYPVIRDWAPRIPWLHIAD